MCGICGIFTPAQIGREAVGQLRGEDRARLARMNAALTHRGPDSAGDYAAPGVGLAMRRLAIIDLKTGDQPIANEDETVWIVFNGEIYNFPELRSGLEERGHIFRTQADTEVIVHLYEEHGAECVQHLNGQFAFAIWDARARRLMLARDRLGQKPLYYAQQDGTLYFSSELPSLLTALPTRPALHLPALDQYLSLQYVPDPLTPYEGVYKLPAAHRLIVPAEGHAGTPEPYWRLNYGPKWDAPEEELAERLRTRTRKAVHMRLLSEVPLGAHLSGGIDSSIIVALMAEATSQVKTFSVGFEEGAFSELAYARQIVERYNTEHHEFILTFENIPETLAAILAHTGEPFADPSALPLWHLARLTRQHVTVALNGDGGDEAFAGYQRYWLDPWANRYLKLPGLLTRGLLPRILHALPDPANRPVGGSLLNGLKRLALLPHVPPHASILRWSSYFSVEQKSRLWREAFHPLLDYRQPERALVAQYAAAQAKTPLDSTLHADITTYLPGDLLVKADRMTMAHSLEGRSPFLDYALMEWAARLPTHCKVRGRTGKYLLRKAFADKLPERIAGRGKQGFGIPVGAWFRGPLERWARDMLLSADSPLQTWFNPSAMAQLLTEHTTGRADHGKRIWALAALGVWAAQQN